MHQAENRKYLPRDQDQAFPVKTNKPHRKSIGTWPSLKILALLIGPAVLLIGFLLFSEGSFLGKTTTSELSPKEAAKLEKKLKEIDDSEQYALVAASDGFYPCLHSGRITYYLLAGEIWKYGVTSKGQFGRYSASFLLKNNVSYIVQFKGNLSECLKQEQIKLFNYPYLPENLARPLKNRLPRPPYNPIMR